MTTFDLSVRDSIGVQANAAKGTNGKWKERLKDSMAVSTADSVSNVKTVRVHEKMFPITAAAESTDGVFKLIIYEHMHPITYNIMDSSGTNIVDSMTIRDFIGVFVGSPGNWNVSVNETTAIADTTPDTEIFAQPGLHFYGYGWAYGIYEKLTVSLAGLDCGDHDIAPDGSIYVPWLSDPDKLLTAAYLFGVSNNPPDEGFGGSACAIDLTSTIGNKFRIVVSAAIGVSYTSTIQTMPPNAEDENNSQYGPSLAETRRLHQYGAFFANAQSVNVGTKPNSLRPAIFCQPNGSKYPVSKLFTGIHWDVVEDDYDFDGMLMMQIARPHPAIVAAVISFMKTMDRE